MKLTKTKWLWIIIGVMVFIGIFFAPKEKSKIPYDSTLENTPFAEMTTEQKTSVLNLFVEGKREPYKTHHYNFEYKLQNAFKKFVKFPNTLQFQNPLGGWSKSHSFLIGSRIKDADKGISTISGLYRAENKLSMKVQGKYFIDYKYDGKNVEIIDIQTE